MPQVLLLCTNCGKLFPSGISMAPGSSVTLIGNKSRCPYCKSLENIPDGTFRATINGFIEILQNSDSPLEEAKRILDGLEKARKTGDFSSVPFSKKIETFLSENKMKITIGIAILKVIIDLLSKQPSIEINNDIINQEFYNIYNTTININIEGKKEE